MQEDTSSMEGTDIEQNCSNEETTENNECAYVAECTSRQDRLPQNHYDKEQISRFMW